ncbi:MAG TPA: M28 family peptidase [Candidatus Acidoferrum sp.]|nr:M28 family peptidase [Candidatus Acidoferrum sp.]
MKKALIFPGVVSVALLAAGLAAADNKPKGPKEDGTMPSLVKIAGEGMMNSRAYQYLTELSDDIGARVTGSPGERKSEEWAVAKMKAMGLENVHTEKYMIWRGWTRGTADAKLLSPMTRPLHIDAMGWVGSTPAGGADADVVPVELFNLDDEAKNLGRLKGKIVLVQAKGKPKKDIMSIFADFGNFLKSLSSAGVIAVIGGQGGSRSAGMNLTHTGILGFDADFSVPVVSMTAEDQGQLERFVARGITPRMHINVQNTLTNGPVETANVVGEIRGTEHPEQVFVVGGHLDSWDLSQGTTDNGSGTAATLGAADTILRAGLRPKRTLRFVLFTGEEQGLDGSFAYYKQHKGEWTNHLGDLILDEGQGIVKNFQMGGRDDLVPVMEAFAESVSNLRNVKVNDKIESGTDTLPFSMYGLPGINMEQDGKDYTYTHHSAADALEAQKPDILAQNATLMAITAYWIADRPERLAEPWSDERTAKMLRDQHEYEELKAFGLWPYGELGADKKDKSE